MEEKLLFLMLACSGREVVVAPVSRPFNVVIGLEFLLLFTQKLIYIGPRIFRVIQIIFKEIAIVNPFASSYKGR